jgi:hypothetical protein
MDFVEGAIKALEIGAKKPELIYFLSPMALAGFALYVVLQVVKIKNKGPSE